MARTTLETRENEPNSTLLGKAVDTVRHAAHISHEARLLKTVAADTVEDGVYAAKRAVMKTARRWIDVRDEAAYRIKREPFKFVALAVGVGIQLGLVLGWAGQRAARRNQHDGPSR